MERVLLHVTGMSCGHCVKAIEGSVGKLEGVNAVKVDLTEGKVEVAFDPDTVTLETIKETIDEQGYDIA